MQGWSMPGPKLDHLEHRPKEALSARTWTRFCISCDGVGTSSESRADMFGGVRQISLRDCHGRSPKVVCRRDRLELPCQTPDAHEAFLGPRVLAGSSADATVFWRRGGDQRLCCSHPFGRSGFGSRLTASGLRRSRGRGRGRFLGLQSRSARPARSRQGGHRAQRRALAACIVRGAARVCPLQWSSISAAVGAVAPGSDFRAGILLRRERGPECTPRLGTSHGSTPPRRGGASGRRAAPGDADRWKVTGDRRASICSGGS